MPEGKIRGILTGLGMPYEVDFANADDDAHKYAVDKLMEKFGPKGHCTMADYIMFYAEHLASREKAN